MIKASNTSYNKRQEVANLEMGRPEEQTRGGQNDLWNEHLEIKDSETARQS